MSIEATDLEKFNGRKVILTVNPAGDGEAVEIEGTVELANALGVIIKPKGKTRSDIVELENIEQIVFAPETAKKIALKKLSPIEYGAARRHLVDRHGYKLGEINAMTEQEALEFHASLDHKELDLGHVHVVADAEKAEAESAGETASDDDESTEA